MNTSTIEVVFCVAPPPSRSFSGDPVRLLRVPLESGNEEMGRESKIGINWHPLQRGDSSGLLYIHSSPRVPTGLRSMLARAPRPPCRFYTFFTCSALPLPPASVTLTR